MRAPLGGPRRGAGYFFGRRKGKALRAGQRQAFETVVPALRIDLSAPPAARLAELFPVAVESVRLEIGFGAGEHLIDAARSNPNVGFIGAEPFERGLAKAATTIAREDIRNIRLHDADAAPLLGWLPANSLAGIDLFFPDPWPKKRHWKRRFVNAENLARMARVLRAGGIFRFATDVESYVEWTRDEVAKCDAFVSVPRSEREPWPDWSGTRYEAKAARSGRPATYLTYQRQP
jgi:tRNA (guanine-N7-)-methyltransferase